MSAAKPRVSQTVELASDPERAELRRLASAPAYIVLYLDVSVALGELVDAELAKRADPVGKQKAY